MQNSVRRRKRGFTILEVVVVVAVAGIVAPLVVSSILDARESARRNQCFNNLRMIGLALHNYHDVYMTFPPGWVSRHRQGESAPAHGWQASLLPFIEQAPLFNEIDFHVPPSPDEPIYQAVIPSLRCNFDATADINTMRGNFGTSNYSGNFGADAVPRWAPGPLAEFWPGSVDTPRYTNGIFHWNSNTRMRDIIDGTSNTFLAGERSLTSAAGIWVGVTSNKNKTDAVTDCSFGSEINSGLAGYSSGHPGGANIVLGDGSVRFISESIDSRPGTGAEMGIYQKLAAKNDGQVIETP